MDKRQRLEAAFSLQPADRTPVLGGWLAAPEHIMALTGATPDEYWADPFRWGLEVERVLGADGVIGIFVPVARGSFRCVDHNVLADRARYATPEDVLAEIAALPEPQDVEADFDEEAEYGAFVAELEEKQRACGDILWCPAYWEAIPRALWFSRFGYESYFTALALYPDRVRRLIGVSAAQARCQTRLIARAIREGKHPRALLTGEDICCQRGPMVSPSFLERVYFPLLGHALEPLLEVGARVVWHCDGDWRPLLDALFDCGIAGLQGFQPECGMLLENLVERRTRDGEPLLIFGPLAVTTTLTRCTPEEVRAEVHRAIEICRGISSLVLFISNTMTPDVPLENVIAMYAAVRE
jgi:GNAT superfamily N-acetyltransferase